MLFLREKLDTLGETVDKSALHLTFSIVCVFSISANSSCWTFVFPLVYSAGVTVKSIVKGSTVDQDGRIHIGDIILSVSARKKNTDRWLLLLHSHFKKIPCCLQYILC